MQSKLVTLCPRISEISPALFGIDMIADMVAGATVYAIEGTFSRGGLYHFVDGEVRITVE